MGTRATSKGFCRPRRVIIRKFGKVGDDVLGFGLGNMEAGASTMA